MNKDAYYFPHFSNARGDRKIKRVMSELGAEGYAIYFMLLEVLREEQGFKYPLTDIDLLAGSFHTTKAKIEAVIKGYKLFQLDEDKNFFSHNFIMFLKPYTDRKEKARQAALIRWHGSDYANNALALPKQCDSNASKEEESKLKKSKEEKDYKRFYEFKNSDFENFNDIFTQFLNNHKNSNVQVGTIINKLKHQSQIGLMQGWGYAAIYNKATKMFKSGDYLKK